MPDVHARLSASSAKRWMSCPPSVALEDHFGDEESEYAAEGTFAHSLAELILRYNNGEMSKKAFTARHSKLKENPYYSRELQDYVEGYTKSVWEIVNEARASCPDAQILFEQRLDFSEYVPEGFGTGDVVIVADDMVDIIDLKYGKGVGVSAEENPQLRLYGLGACLEHSLLYDIRRVRMTIIQPRLENISVEEMSTEDLINWAEYEVAPRAVLAMSGGGEFKPGDHCRFCKARKTCRARADHNMELAKLDFQDADLLSDEEIALVLQRAKDLTDWVKDITDYAYTEALAGKKFEGWKLVEGRSNRTYADDAEAEKKLQESGYTDIHKPKELLGITAMEKLMGKKKFAEVLKDLVIKPEGKPVLVAESDKRPALTTVGSAVDDFSEEGNAEVVK